MVTKLKSSSDVRCLGGWLRQAGAFFEYDQGPTVPMAALELMMSLDARGLCLQRNHDRLRVYREDGAAPNYLPGEKAAIAQYKHHLLAIMEYQPPEAPTLEVQS